MDPCATFDRAYQVAQPGEVVELAGGEYTTQRLGSDASKTSHEPVVMRPAAGSAVRVQNLFVEGASHLAIRGIAIDDQVSVQNHVPDQPGSEFVTLEHLTATTLSVVGHVSHITIRGGSFGNALDNQPQIKKYNPEDPDGSRPRDIVIDGATFHDYRRSAPDIHTECLQVISVDTLTIRNSRFNNCDGTGDIGITDGPHDDVTLENNFLGKAGDAFYAVQVTKAVRNLVIRNNSASKELRFSDEAAGGPYLVEGNYMPYARGTCEGDVVYRHNVFAGTTCGSTDLPVTAMRFADEDGFDLHLAPGSEAIDHGSPTSFPATDIDGDARPLGGAPDAGADERDTTADPVPEPKPVTAFVSPVGADGAPCSEAAPCASLQRGYEAVAAGGTVVLRGGDYGKQELAADPWKTGTERVVFLPSEGESPVLDGLAITGASRIAFRDIAVRRRISVENTEPDMPGSSFVTLERMTATTLAVVGRVSDIEILGGSFGASVDWPPQIKKYNPGDPSVARPRDILVDGVRFHDHKRSTPSEDTACLQVLSVDGLTIRGSRFNNCDGNGGIAITDGPIDDVTIENNFLGKAGDAFYAMQMTLGQRNLVVRHNSSSAAMVFSGEASSISGPYLVTGNYMRHAAGECSEAVTYRFNVFQNGACDPTDRNVQGMRFVNEEAFDLHLTQDSEAIDRGDPASFPETDIDGDSRPLGNGPDAGADEAVER